MSRFRNFILIVVALLAVALFGLPEAWSQDQKTVVALGDFQGIMKHPALARALSQEIAETLAMHPAITVIPRDVLTTLMRQNNVTTISSNKAAELATVSKAQVMITGEIVEENNALSVQLRLFQAESGKSLGSRRMSASYQDIQKIPAQASKAVVEMLSLPIYDFPVGAGNLSSLIEFGEGLSLSDQGKFSEAAQKFADAKATDESFHLSHTWQKRMASNGLKTSNDALERIHLLRLQGDNAGALEELKKAQTQGLITGVSERVLRAELLLENGDTKAATGEIEALIRSGSEDPMVFFNLGRVMRATGKVDESVKAFEKAKALDSKNGEIMVHLGELYQVQGDFKKSAQEFKNAGDLVYANLNYQGALVLYRRARAIQPQDWQIMLAEAKTLLELGAFSEVIPILETALQGDAKNYEIMTYLGRAYFLQGDTTKSIKYLKASFQGNPEDFTVNYYLGLYYAYDQGNKESQKLALQYLQTATTLQPENKDALLALARMFRALGMVNQAKQAYEALRALDNENYIVIKEAGDFLRETGSFQEAEVLYSEAVRLNPDYLDAREDLGRMYQEQGNKEKADEQFALIRKIDPSSAGRESIVYRQLAELMKTLPNQARTEFGVKPIENVALIDFFEKKPTKFFGRLQHFLSFKKIDHSKFIFTLEQGLLSRYVVHYLSDVKDQVSNSGYTFDRFKSQASMQALCRTLSVDGLAVVEVEEMGKSEDQKQTKFRLSVKMFDRVTPAYWGNATIVTLDNKEYYKFNIVPVLILVVILLAGLGFYLYEKKIGRGNVTVVIRYNKKDVAGYFSLKLSKKQNDPWATRVGKGNKKFTKKATFRSKSEEYMVGDETQFKKFRSGKHYVHLFGNIAEKADKSKIVGTFSIAKPVTVKKNETAKVEFNLIEDEAYVEVIVEFQGRLLSGAEVACKETGTSSVTKAEQGAAFNLRPGLYHFTASYEDLRANHTLNVTDLEAKETKIEMHEANRFVAQGQFEQAAEIFVQAGDEIEAARMFEKAGMLLKACRILGEKFIREENYEKALACYKRAEDYESMAALYQRMGDMEKSYRSFGMGFMLKKEFDDAIRMFSEIKDYENLAKAFAAKGDTKNQYCSTGEYHKAKGEDLEAAGAFERGEDFVQAGAAYERVGNLIKAGEMFVQANEHTQAGELFLKAGDHTRAAMAFEKGGKLERAAELYHGLGDTDKAPKVLLEAGKFIDAAKAYRANGLLDEALAALRRVGVNHEDFVDACDLMSVIFEEKGEMGLALQAAQRGLESVVIDDSNLDRFHALGKRQEASGEINAAINTFEKILSVNMEYQDLTHHVRTLKENLQARTVMGTSSMMGAGAQARSDGTVAGSSRYEIIKEIGRGGMGVVYQAKDKLLERVVAYKLLPDHIKDNSEALAAFLREAKAAAKLTHQNMVTIFDTGQENGNYYITMEFVEGQTLKQLLTRSPKQLRPIDVVTVALMICDGLSYAHKNHIIHRDIKPSNIMINKSRQVKIMDFGLATVMQTAALDKTLMRGTPLYMAPEMILGQGVDYRSDLYSMGITLYEMAAKRVPFTTGDVAYHHLHTPPPSPRQFNPAIPAELEAMIMKAIAKKQDERFQNMDELIASLKRLEQILQSAQTQTAAQV